MSIWKVAKLTLYPPKECKIGMKSHPIIFISVMTMLLIFFAPVIMFDYVVQKQWRL